MGSLSILVVENEAVVALDIETKLTNYGYDVVGIASSFEEGVHFLEHHAPNLILMDIIIDGKRTGIDLANEIKKHYKIPVIFLTANSNQQIINQVKGSNPYGFINKPFDPKDLVSAIEIAHNKFLYEQSIIESEKQLQQLNEELEHRVRERTKELLEKNEHLKTEIKLRNEIEQSLYFSEKLYRDTINNLGSGLAIINKSGKTVTVNNSLCDYLGFDKEALISQSVLQFLPQKTWREIQLFFKNNLQHLWNSELQFLKKGGDTLWCQLFVSTSMVEEADYHYVFSIINISQQKTNEELLAIERKHRVKSLMEGEERERKRIAKDLHDGLGQKLTAVKLSMGSVLLGKAMSDTQSQVLKDAKTIVEESIQELREVSQNLSPSVLIDYGLVAALEKMCASIKESHKLRIELSLHVKNKRFPIEQETTLYRIAQEALNNALKYAEATEILISLSDEQDHLMLSISDNGKGFDNRLGHQKMGNGLLNMKERCLALNADFDIISEIGKGTQVVVKLRYEM